jgi:hypothetical protein
MDNYVQTLLKTQTAENRADIVACLKQLDGIDSIKPSKDFLTVTLSSGKKHRLKGDFYNEKFEIGSYSEHLRAAAENRATANELAAALTDADQLRATYRTKRETYHRRHHAFAQRTADNNSPRIAPTLDFDSDKESITPSNTNAHNELYGANTSITSTAMQYRYIEHRNRHNQHRFVFNINPDVTGRNQQPVGKHHDRSREPAAEYPRPDPTRNSEPKRAVPERHPDLNHGKIERTEIQIHFLGDDRFWTADSFNRFISGLSNQYKSEDHRSTARSHSTEHTTNFKSNQNLESIAEISNADRNRPFLKEQNDLLIQQNNLLTEQNNALNQQVSSLKSILSKYSEVEQSLQNKISNLNTERETQQALILAMKSELSKLEQGNFSEQLQQAFQNNVLMQLQTQLTRALNQLDLNSIVSDLVKTELKPIQSNINTQQTDLRTHS